MTMENEIVEEEKVKAYLLEHLSKKRVKHIYGVVDVAERLAEKYGVSVSKVRAASLLHDVGKRFNIEEMVEFLKEREHILPEEYYITRGLLHATVGYYIAREEFNVNDIETLSAILHHTTGAKNLGMVEKIVYIADYLDPNRGFSNQKDLYALAAKDLNKALLKVVVESVNFVFNKRSILAADTIEFYNELVKANE